MNDPDLYSRSNPFQVRDASQVLGVYSKHMCSRASDAVLDIGCGSGDVTARVLCPAIGRRFRLLVAVDRETEMVRYASCRSPQAGVHYAVLDIVDEAGVRAFRGEWGGFDKVYSFYCLHWISDLLGALRNIHFLMRKGAECLLVFVSACPVFEMYERMAEMDKWKTFMKDVNEFVPRTQHLPQPSFVFSQLMEQVGLEPISCSTLNRSFAFSSTQMLKDCMVAVNPFINRIPDHQRNEYIEDCIRTLSAIKIESGNVNENESCCFSYKLLVAHGTRIN